MLTEIVRTSEVAAHAFSRKVAREAAKHNTAVLDAIAESVNPMWAEIRQRGKVPRNKLRTMAESIVRHIHGDRANNLLWSRSSITRPSLMSVQEKIGIRMIVATSNPEARYEDSQFDFMACDLSIGRSAIELRIDVVNAAVQNHALARFVGPRGQSDMPTFFRDILRPIRAASILASAATHHPNMRILLPHAHGFMLGTVELHDDPDDEERMMPCLIRFDRMGRESRNDEPTSVVKGARLITRMWSFVPAEAASPTKAPLYEAILAWERRHHRAISDWFEMQAFGSAGVEPGRPMREGMRAAGEAIRDAMLDAKALGETPMWARFDAAREQS